MKKSTPSSDWRRELGRQTCCLGKSLGSKFVVFHGLNWKTQSYEHHF